MQLLKKRHYKISNVNEKLSLWQQELNLDISKTYHHFKECLLYFVLKSWVEKIDSSNNSLDKNSHSNNSSYSLNPEDDFIVVNKTTWYSIKGKIKVKHSPIRKLGYFCNKKLVFVFDNFCYFFYKDKALDENTIYEGYLNFINKHNFEKVVYLLETNEINSFFEKINADVELYNQILYYKGNTFELILKNNIQNRTGYNEIEQMNNNNPINNQNKSEKSIFSSNFQKIFNRKKINNQLNSNEKNSSIESNYRSNNSARNISLDHNNNSISIEKHLSRERSCNNISSRRNYLSKNLDIIPDHFPNRKLSKTEDENLNKILKAVICYYCFNKFFMLKLDSQLEINDINLCMIHKDWLKFFKTKYNFEKIKKFLDKKYEYVDENNYLEYKDILIKACRIKDFLLVKNQPIKPLEKEFTEFGQEYYENYELISNNCYLVFKEAFGSYELDEIREFKINIIKKRGIIINYNPNQIEISTMYMLKKNNNDNSKPERYLIVLWNNKYMNFRIKRPLEENGIEEGMKLINTERNDEDDEEYFKIKINNETIGSLINITNPINKTFGNFIPSKPSLIGLKKDEIIFGMNSVIQCLNNIPLLIGYFLNKKRMKQIELQKETKPFSFKLLKIIQNLWSNNEENKEISAQNLSEYLLEMNPFLSGNDSNPKELLYYIINLVQQELNKIENINHYLVNNKIKFNYKLCYEKFYNYFKNNYKSIISDIFYGFKNDTLTCSKCFNTSHSINFYDIMIFPPYEIRCYKKYSKNIISIEECFDFNERKIELYNCRNYFCNFCNNYANGVLATKLVSLPKVLILAFERKEEKDFEVNINFEEFLNLRKYVFYDTNSYKYELIGAIKNLNKFEENKKYVAFCKSTANKMWYLYDDETVVKTEFKDVKETGNVNILIYNNYIDNK